MKWFIIVFERDGIMQNSPLANYPPWFLSEATYDFGCFGEE